MKRKEVSQFPSETMSSKSSKSGIRKVGYAVTCSRFVFFSQMHILVEREARSYVKLVVLNQARKECRAAGD